jgi:hypothetical protein
MKNLSVKIKGVLFIFILILLIVPIIQNKFNIIKIEPLKGAITEPEKKYFSIKDWLSGDYQEQEEKYLNETFGLRSFFIRINNQIAFSFFGKAKANGVIIGKNNYLYEENYIKAYYGTDFIGIDSINNRIQRLKFIQDTLKKLNKTIIVVFAAGKGSFYPEYFPDEYITKLRGKTNYEYHVKFAKEAGLNFIDFNKFFIENKNKSKYSLYPQFGVHWSYYGMAIAADSIIRYIEKTRKIDMPNLFWDELTLDTDNSHTGDNDIIDGMNLLFKLKSFPMAYPHIKFQSDSGKTKPSVLVVSDSFYWAIFNFGFPSAFSTNHFWFYNRQIFPDSYQKPFETSQVNLRDEINKHDVIIIMANEATLPKLGWGFIENTYSLYIKNYKNK